MRLRDEEAREVAQLLDGAALVPRHQAALHDVLDQQDVEGGEDGLVVHALQLLDLSDRLVGVLLGLVHVAGLEEEEEIRSSALIRRKHHIGNVRNNLPACCA